MSLAQVFPGGSSTGSQHSPLPGTLRPLLCGPRGVLWRVRGVVCAAGRHLRARREDYAFLYELLSVGVPLLALLGDVLTQVYAESLPLQRSTT